MAKEFSGTVKEILGTATSVGCTIEGQNPRDIIAQINDGTIEIPVIFCLFFLFYLQLFFAILKILFSFSKFQ